MTSEYDLDVKGMLCPLPVLRARKRLAAMNPGDVLRIIATDPAARIDMPHYCAESGHWFLGEYHDGETWVFRIQRKDTSHAE